MTKSTTISVDLAKNVFEVAISPSPGRVAQRKRLRRPRFATFFEQQPPARVVMEACGSANYWGRRLQQMGHEVILLPPHQVRPYVTRNKTDRVDAQALLEALRNEEIHPVPLKSVDMQAVQAMHRVRESWVRRRVRVINMVRGLLREFGIFIPQGPRLACLKLGALLGEEGSELPRALRPLLHRIREELEALETSIKAAEIEIRNAPQDPAVDRLQTIPGIGPLSASALVATVGDIRRFPSGRRLASYLGLTARENSSAERRRLGGINKKGNTYVRTLFIHGARCVMRHVRAGTSKDDRVKRWAKSVSERRGYQIATVALAAKNARLAWAVWREGRTFEELNYSKMEQRPSV